MTPSLAQLRAIIEIAESRNVTRAAENMGISQPAMTRLLRGLEQRLNVELFERTRTGMIPTTYGQSYLGHARAIVEELKRAGDDLTAIRDQRAGELSIGVTPVVSWLVPRAISSLRRQRPGIRIIAHSNRLAILMPELMSGQMEMIIGPINTEEIALPVRTELLFTSTLDFIVARDHPLAGVGRIELGDLCREEKLILPPKSVFRRQDLDNLFKQQGLEPLIGAVETTSLSIIRSLMLEEQWIAVLPEGSFRSDINDGVIVRLDLGDELIPTRRDTGIVTHKSRPLSITAQEMLRHLRMLTRDS